MNFSLFNKLAFIANLAFITAIVMRFYPILQGTLMESLILITGLIISPILNCVLNLYYLYLYFRGEQQYGIFLQAFNAGVFGLQLVIIVFFSGLLSLSNTRS